jgi:tetratricopeptide (TPR) repeat protein
VSGRLAPLAAIAFVATSIVLALYGRALDYQLAWMDETEIGQGAIVLAPGEPWTKAFTRPLHASAQGVNPYYRPLQILAATAVYRVAGPTPRFYRAVLLAAAIGTCFAFGALAWRLLANLPLALAATALAAAHPAMIEGWVWISGLGEALSGCFVVASVAAAVLALDRTGRARALWSGIALATLALALLAKEKAVVVPALVGAFWLARAIARRDASDRAPLVLIGAELAVVALYAIARPLLMGRGLVAAAPIGGDRVTHVLSAIASWPASIGWLVFPLHSSASDAVAVVRTPADPRVLLGVALPIASLAAAFWLARRGRPIAAFGIAWIWIAFAPTANLFPQIHAHAERYLFLSVFGLALAAGDLADAVAARVAPGVRLAAASALVGLVAVGVAQRTWARTPVWQSTETLFHADVATDPGYREGRFHLASALVAQGRFAEADLELRELRRPPPADRSGYVNAIGVEELACAVDVGLGRTAQAIAEYQRHERESSGLANDPGLRSCAAQALEAAGRPQEAAALYERVIASLAGQPPPAALSLALARAYAKSGRRDDAQRWLARAEADGPREPAFDGQLRQVERLLR